MKLKYEIKLSLPTAPIDDSISPSQRQFNEALLRALNDHFDILKIDMKKIKEEIGS